MKATKRDRKVAIAAAIIVAALGLGTVAWFATTSGGPSKPAASPSAEDSPAPLVPIEPDRSTVDVKHGDVLDTAPSGPLAEDGLLATELVDGTYVVVDPRQPAPEAVRESIASEAGAAINGLLGAPDDAESQMERLEQFAAYTAGTTGRWPLVVVRAERFLNVTGDHGEAWVAWGRIDDERHTTSIGEQGAVIAEVEQWAASVGGDKGYEVVLAD